MPVYFRGPQALITHREFIRISPPAQAYALRDLLHPHVVIARNSHEVHAFYQGRRVCLFRTTDLRLFGQIKRALVRALEAQDERSTRT